MATPLTRREWLAECEKLAKVYEDAMTENTPSDALVERLRDFVIAEDIDLAADLIETQAREIERLREALANIGNLSLNGCIKVDTQHGLYVGTPDAYAREVLGMPWRSAALGEKE